MGIFSRGPKTYSHYIKSLESQKYWVDKVNKATTVAGSIATTVYLSSIPGIGYVGSAAAGAAVGGVSKIFGNSLRDGFDKKIKNLETLKAKSDKTDIHLAQSEIDDSFINNYTNEEYINISEVNKFGMERLYNLNAGKYETHKADGKNLEITTNSYTKSRYVEDKQDDNGNTYYLESDKMYKIGKNYEQLVKVKSGEVDGVPSYSRDFVENKTVKPVTIKRIYSEFIEEHGADLTKALKLSSSELERDEYIKQQMKNFEPSVAWLWGGVSKQKVKAAAKHGEEYDKLMDIIDSYHMTMAARNPMERVDEEHPEESYVFVAPKKEIEADLLEGWSFEDSVIDNLDKLVENTEEEIFYDIPEYLGQ